MNDDEPPPNPPPTSAPAPIEELVRQIQGSSDPRARLARPLSSERRAAIAARAIEQAGAGASLERAPKVAPLPRSKRRSTWGWLAMAATLAASGIAVVLLRPAPPSRVAARLEVRVESALRASAPASLPEAGVLVVSRASKIVVTLTPAAREEKRVLAAAVVARGAARRLWPAAVATEKGGFEIRAAASSLGESSGPVELALVLAPTNPEDDDVERWVGAPPDSADGAPQGVSIFRKSLWIVDGERAVEVAGCAARIAGGACEIAAGATLRLFAKVPSNALSIRIDGREEIGERKADRTGTRIVLRPPPGAAKLELIASGEVLLDLALRPAFAAPLLEKALDLRQKKDFAGAEKALDEIAATGSASARREALRLRAKIAWAKGDVARADALRAEVIAQARAEGRTSEEAEATFSRVFSWIFVARDFVAARRALDEIAPKLAGDAESLASLAYYRGLLADEIGDLREALAQLELARGAAARLSLAGIASAVREPLADVLATLGRGDEAMALVMGIGDGEKDPCLQAERRSSEGWIGLRAGHLGAARKAMESAVLLASGCPGSLAKTRLNLAFLEAEEGRPDEAKKLLADGPRGERSPRLRAWQRRLELRLSLMTAAKEALSAADLVERTGLEAASPELLFEAAFGRARALEALGRWDDARRAYADVENRLDAWARLVPLGEGRDTFLSQHESASRAHVTFLVADAERSSSEPDRQRAALALLGAVRRTLARPVRTRSPLDGGGLAGTGERGVSAFRAAQAHMEEAFAGGPAATPEDRLSTARAIESAQNEGAGELPARAEGELVLAFHGTGAGWVGVAWGPGEEVTWSAHGAAEARNETTLIEPFQSQIERARRIRILADRTFRGAHLHALSWKGKPLHLSVPVAFGVEGFAPPPAAPAAPGPYALLVSDPTSDLAGASASSSATFAAVSALGFRVVQLSGKEARKEAIAALLQDPNLGLFHYDGHGHFAGRDGTGAALDLADGPLTVLDVLALRRAPPYVVLSGCDTGQEEGAGLALAFLERGAREVVAAIAPVHDEQASLLARGLYTGGAAGPSRALDLVSALRRAGAGVSSDQAALFLAFVR